MKVLMLTSAASRRGVYDAGKVYDVPRDLAKEWLEADPPAAEMVSARDSAAAEVASVEPSETTDRPRGRPRKAGA